MPPSEDTSGARNNGHFATTQWTAVVAAGADSSPEARRALEQICANYWYPLYAHVRRNGHNPHDAQDLTQEFFARLIERNYLQHADPHQGRFRTFLLTSLKRFLVNDWKRAHRQKRGNGHKASSLDETQSESRFAAEPALTQPPDTLYDRGWAHTILDRAMTALRAEWVQAGKLALFDRLKVIAWGESSMLPYAVLGTELGMTEDALKTAVHRLRRRYRELVRAEVALTVSSPDEVDEELRYLLSVIRDARTNFGNLTPGNL